MRGMIKVTDTVNIPDDEVAISFMRASGPGGQNVNKVSTAVQLRFDVAHSWALPAEAKSRLLSLAGQRATAEGVLLIKANRFRTQDRNRQDAIERLVALVRVALVRPRPRKKTRVPHAARQQRLRDKKRKSALKATRRAGWDE